MRCRSYSIVIVPDLINAAEDWKPSAKSELAQANKNARVFVYEYSPPRASNGAIEITPEEMNSHTNFLQTARLYSETTDGESTQASDPPNGLDNVSGRNRRDQVPVILVACGYGGLLCELALVSDSD